MNPAGVVLGSEEVDDLSVNLLGLLSVREVPSPFDPLERVVRERLTQLVAPLERKYRVLIRPQYESWYLNDRWWIAETTTLQEGLVPPKPRRLVGSYQLVDFFFSPGFLVMGPSSYYALKIPSQEVRVSSDS